MYITFYITNNSSVLRIRAGTVLHYLLNRPLKYIRPNPGKITFTVWDLPSNINLVLFFSFCCCSGNRNTLSVKISTVLLPLFLRAW